LESEQYKQCHKKANINIPVFVFITLL